MRKIISALFFLIGTGFPFIVSAFSVVAPTGQSLNFTIVNGAEARLIQSNPVGDLEIPAMVTYNGITYPVNSIGVSALSCHGLTSVIIPNTVSSILANAFAGCENLAWVYIPNSVNTIDESAFCYCTGLTSIVIPNSIMTIEYQTFEGCSQLSSIVIPNSVTSIKSHAFYGCANLTNLTLGCSVSSISSDAFTGCHIETLNYNAINCTVPTTNSSVFGTSLRTVDIGNSVEVVPNNAFSNCSVLTTVTIGNSVTSIGPLAFRNCSNLNSISVANDNPAFDSRDCCNAIIETATNTLIIGCRRTVIPNTISYIGNYSFSNCVGLVSKDIPNSVSSIGHMAFSGCYNLRKVHIGEAVSFIGANAFAYCSQLDSVYFYSRTPAELGNDVFQFSNSNLVVAVPCGSQPDYHSAWGMGYNYVSYGDISVDDTQVACDRYVWNGIVYDSSVVETKTLSASEGCDSIVTLQLTINHSLHSHEYITHCGPFTWNLTGRTYNQSGDKFHRDTTAEGRSVQDTLSLTVLAVYNVDSMAKACDTFTWYGETYSESADPTYLQAASNGCDSVITLHLTINHSQSNHEYVDHCGPYTWVKTGRTYYQSGDKFYRDTTAEGCAVRDTLSLTVLDVYYVDSIAIACDSFTWHGETYNESTNPTQLLEASNGCDSVVTLHLTVNYSSETIVMDTAESGYLWHGTNCTESGIYHWQGATEASCDSTVTLILVINPAGFDVVDSKLIDVNVYPNPTSGWMIINAADVLSVDVFDLAGHMVANYNQVKCIDLGGLPKGVYTLRIHLLRGMSVNKVILK